MSPSVENLYTAFASWPFQEVGHPLGLTVPTPQVLLILKNEASNEFRPCA